MIVAAALHLSGCVKQDSTWTPINIAFKPLIGHDTRAVVSVPFPQDQNFDVWAVDPLTGCLYIDGEEITHSSEGWISSKLWPRQDLDFEACWPTDLPMEYTSGKGLQLKNFDCSTGDIDILLARASDNNNNDGVATLRFDHILSRVDFRMLHSLGEDMSVRVKTIKMIGVVHIGNFNTEEKYEWSTENADFTYVVYDAGETDGTDISAGNARYIGKEFFCIPQICTACLEVSYDIRYGTASWVPQTDTIESLSTYWETGKYYTYTINIRPDKMTHTTGISSWNNRE